jgi:hypothetical protein
LLEACLQSLDDGCTVVARLANQIPHFFQEAAKFVVLESPLASQLGLKV